MCGLQFFLLARIVIRKEIAALSKQDLARSAFDVLTRDQILEEDHCFFVVWILFPRFFFHVRTSRSWTRHDAVSLERRHR